MKVTLLNANGTQLKVVEYPDTPGRLCLNLPALTYQHADPVVTQVIIDTTQPESPRKTKATKHLA